MNDKYGYLILAIIILTACFLRFYPATQSDHLLKFDSYYHARVAELISVNGLTDFEPWPYGGKPHIYPPGYHFLMIAVSYLGIGFMTLAQYLLPAIFALSIIPAYLLARKYSGRDAALVTSMLLAVNSVLITESFGSPQGIGFLFFLAALFLYLEKKYVLSGLIMGVCFWFSSMAGVFFSIPLIIHLVISKREKFVQFTAPAIAIALSWIVFRWDLFYSYSNAAFAFFSKSVSFSQFIDPYYILLVGLVIPFVKLKNDYQKIWFILAMTSFAFYLSFYFTNLLHPWRQSFFLMIALCFLAGEVLSKNMKLLVIFSAVSLFMVSMVSFPGLTKADYTALDSFNANDVVLAGHDTCAVILTVTKAQCMLDIGFESIGNKTQFNELESFFWSATPNINIMKYAFNKVMINSNAWGDLVLSDYNLTKKEIVFQCWDNYCMKPASIYER